MTYQMTSMLIGVALATAILWLVRRDHLHGPYAFWWIGMAIAVVVLGLFPGIFDYLARYLGISYPPILAVVLGFALLLVKILTMDLERSRQERRIRRLAQRLAILEGMKAVRQSGEVEDDLTAEEVPPSPFSQGPDRPCPDKTSSRALDDGLDRVGG